MKHSKLRTLGVALGFAALAAVPVTMTDWQVHTGEGKVTYSADLDKDALGPVLVV